jgi:hypothetical protein
MEKIYYPTTCFSCGGPLSEKDIESIKMLNRGGIGSTKAFCKVACYDESKIKMDGLKPPKKQKTLPG